MNLSNLELDLVCEALEVLLKDKYHMANDLPTYMHKAKEIEDLYYTFKKEQERLPKPEIEF